jgi:hypothetical protein
LFAALFVVDPSGGMAVIALAINNFLISILIVFDGTAAISIYDHIKLQFSV